MTLAKIKRTEAYNNAKLHERTWFRVIASIVVMEMVNNIGLYYGTIEAFILTRMYVFTAKSRTQTYNILKNIFVLVTVALGVVIGFSDMIDTMSGYLRNIMQDEDIISN